MTARSLLGRVAAAIGDVRAAVVIVQEAGGSQPDRRVLFTEGIPDLPACLVAAHQPQRRFEGQSRREQPAHDDVGQLAGDLVVIFCQPQDQPWRVT